MDIVIEGPRLGTAGLCEPVLRSLPDWFGREEANLQYLKDLDVLPTFLARRDGQVTGFLTIRQHFQFSAEVHIMAVRLESHRQGLGTALVAAAESFLVERGVEYLQVKTLSPSRADEGYAGTRAFYSSVGFRPLEEFHNLWGTDNPCLMMIKYLGVNHDQG